MEMGTLIGGRYRLEEIIGRGANGVVWRAAELLPDGDVLTYVAVKVFNSEVERRELQILATCGHPNILGYRAIAEHEGQVCLVTELADGLSEAIEVASRAPTGAPRFIWVVTDGDPTDALGHPAEDHLGYLERVAAAADLGLSVGAVGLGDAKHYRHQFLRDLSDRGRGSFCYAPDPETLSAKLAGQLAAAHDVVASQGRMECSPRPSPPAPCRSDHRSRSSPHCGPQPGGLDGAGITTSPPTLENGYGYDVGSLVLVAAAAGIETVAVTVGLVW